MLEDSSQSCNLIRIQKFIENLPFGVIVYFFEIFKRTQIKLFEFKMSLKEPLFELGRFFLNGKYGQFGLNSKNKIEVHESGQLKMRIMG